MYPLPHWRRLPLRRAWASPDFDYSWRDEENKVGSLKKMSAEVGPEGLGSNYGEKMGLFGMGCRDG